MSASSAAATPAFPQPFTAPNAAFPSCCWKPTSWASAPRGGTAGRSARARQDQVWLEKTAGRDNARRLWDLAQDAKQLVRDLIARHRMPVTFYPGIAHACWSDAEVREAHLYAEKLHRDYGYEQLEPLDRAGIQRLIGSTVYKGGEVDRGAGHLHPLNFALGLAQAAATAGARLHEGSEVTAIDHGARPVVRTASGQVTCSHVILAANGYLGKLEPEISARVMPINNFIVATEPLGDPRARSCPNPSPWPTPSSSSTTGGFRKTTACSSRRRKLRLPLPRHH